MLKKAMWAPAVLGECLLLVAARPAALQEGREAGGAERDRAAPEGQERGGARPAPQGERAPAGETDRARAPDAQGTERARERVAQTPASDAARVGPAQKLAEIELVHAKHLARIERLMEIYREKGDKEKLLELEQMRDRETNQYEKHLAELEREVGPERFRTARATLNEQRRGATDRARDAAPGAGAETDAARRARAEREGQGAGRETDRPTDRPVGKPEDRPVGRPADRPAGKPEDRPGDKPPGRPAEKPADKPRGENPSRGERENQRDGGLR